MVSRLYGHSSSSGALRGSDEPDCIESVRENAWSEARRVTLEATSSSVREAAQARSRTRPLEQALREPKPRPSGRGRRRLHTYAPSPVDAVYPGDYTATCPRKALNPRIDGHARSSRSPWRLHYGEKHLGVTDIFGEDVGPPLGGVFTATQGLKTAWNSPLDERGIIGTAMGIAYAGGRPVAEIQFCDYGFNTIDLLKVAGNQRWAGAGQLRHADRRDDARAAPASAAACIIRTRFESWASRLAGWKIVMPSNPLDAYGLMLSAIVDPNPVMVLLPKALLRVRGEQLIPGEPDDEKQLKEMIDAPVGDRSHWQPRWPERASSTSSRSASPRSCARGRRHRRQLWPHAAALCVQAADRAARGGAA